MVMDGEEAFEQACRAARPYQRALGAMLARPCPPERVVPLRQLSGPHDPAALDTKFAAQYNVNRFGIESMLLRKNAR